MIFIITHKQDYTADFVIDKLNNRNINYYRFNCEDIDEKGYSFKLGDNTEFIINGISSIDSIWFRRTKLPSINTALNDEKLFLLNEYDSLFENMYHLLKPKKWLSFPPYVYQAENKLFQLMIAKKIGFKIPETIVTNSHDELIEFAKKHSESIIIKPLGHGRVSNEKGVKNIFTNKLNTSIIEEINNYYLSPSIFQEYIEKVYEIRVTIVGEKVFSAKVDSQSYNNTKVDWRRDKIKFEPYSLPTAIENKCIELNNLLGISFGAIDLIKSPDNSYTFLEINPNGQWAWIETDTKLEISNEIIKYLTKWD